ncbi:MAG TPA: type II toxin-antitoxin system ParD family antitoxin [Pirellulales bacterium]|nr:type II toxin-antitoxin system ParD family antitoxin [Pirellulales bacterium]
MSVEIPSDLVPFVHSVIANGQCADEREVVGKALRLMEAIERKREKLRADVLEGINSGESFSSEVVAGRVAEWAASLANRPATGP